MFELAVFCVLLVTLVLSHFLVSGGARDVLADPATMAVVQSTADPGGAATISQQDSASIRHGLGMRDSWAEAFREAAAMAKLLHPAGEIAIRPTVAPKEWVAEPTHGPE